MLTFFSNNELINLFIFQQGSGASTVDLRHFAFYAFAGRTGQIRWSRKNEVFSFVCFFFLFIIRCIFVYLSFTVIYWQNDFLQ